MKTQSRRLSWVPIFVLIISALLSAVEAHAAAGRRVSLLCTTYPVYQITRNVIDGVKTVQVDLMISSELGCPHDYSLTPQDMQRLSHADVLIINGLGMEGFLGATVMKANPGIRVIDSSWGIREVLRSQEEDRDEGPRDHSHDKTRQEHSSGLNPHLFASPRMAALIAVNIAEGLALTDPAGAAAYRKNAAAYAARMNRLADELADLGRRLRNNRVVTQHGVFDYLSRDMGLEVVAVIRAHPGQEPSASEMLKIVKTIRQKKAGAVFLEPQFPVRIGLIIAKEAGVPAAVLDPTATGRQNASLDYYEKVMRLNMDVLSKTLGVKKDG